MKVRIRWGRVVRASVAGIRSALSEQSAGGMDITLEEVGAIVDAGLSEIREQLVRAAMDDLRR